MADPNLHARILEAASSRLRVTGLRGINVARVAAAAGVSRPTVYKHVGDADEIVRRLIDRELTRYFDAVAPVMDQDAPIVDRFVEALRFTVTFARENAVLTALLAEETAAVLPLLTLNAQPTLQRAVDLLTPYLQRARQSGEIDIDDLPAAAEWAARMTLSLVLTPPLTDQVDSEERLRGFVAEVLQRAYPSPVHAEGGPATLGDGR